MSAFLSLLTTLGWSLLDSIWQMAALWMAYGFLTSGNKRFSAADNTVVNGIGTNLNAKFASVSSSLK